MPLLAVFANKGKARRAVTLARRNACCRNPHRRCRHNNPAIIPMVAGGVAAGVAGAVANRLLRNPKAIAEGTAPDGTFYRVVRKSVTGEWVVRAWVKGKYHEGRTYYTTDKADALGTFKFLMGQQPKVGANSRRPMRNPGRSYSELIARKKAEYGSKFDDSDLDKQYIRFFESGQRITVDFGYEVKRGTVGVTTGWKPVFLLMLTKRSIGSSHTLPPGRTKILGVVRNCGKNRRRAAPRRFFRNGPAAQTVINVPFRQGRKYSVVAVAKWVEAHGTPAMKKRFAQAMAQYKRFHKGALPKFITYSLYKMGSHQGISDVEFGVSEGREWMAAYQVPKTSGKWADKASDGRYVHAHGDSEIDVDVKRPVKLSKLPMRFHTPDGKAVGVIPSKNVKIGEWYEG